MARAITVRQAVAGAVAVILLSVGASVASAGIAQTFTDVSPSNPFYDEIEAIAAAGITEGYPDGTFRPGANVTRQAMAAFMARGFARIASGQNLAGTPVTPGNTIEVTSLAIEPGATGSGSGFLWLVGTVSASTDDVTSCPCNLLAAISPTDAPLGSSFIAVDTLADTGSATPSTTTLSVQWVVPVEAGGPLGFALEVELEPVESGTPEVIVGGDLVALYVPLPGSTQPPA